MQTLEIELVNKKKDKEIGIPGQDNDCEEIEESKNLNQCKTGHKIHVTAKHKEKVSLFKMYKKVGT